MTRTEEAAERGLRRLAGGGCSVTEGLGAILLVIAKTVSDEDTALALIDELSDPKYRGRMDYREIASEMAANVQRKRGIA